MFDEDERFVTSDFISEDAEIEVGLRPRNLSEYIGQEKAKNNLEIYIKAALERREALDHVLLYGPPGLGRSLVQKGNKKYRWRMLLQKSKMKKA